MVRIRTITASVHLCKADDYDEIRQKLTSAASFLEESSRSLSEKHSLEVQTTRVAFNPLGQWVDLDGSPESVYDKLVHVDKMLESLNILLASIGPIQEAKHISLVEGIIRRTKILNMSISLDRLLTHQDLFIGSCVGQNLDFSACMSAAEAVKGIAANTEGGLGNFRLCISSSVKPGIPFFPSSYFEGETRQFAIGLESSSLLEQSYYQAIDQCKKNGELNRFNLLTNFEENLNSSYTAILQKIEETCMVLDKETEYHYNGIDASMNPALDGEGIGSIFRKMLNSLTATESKHFGSTGTLTLSFIITRAIKSCLEKAKIKLIGYSGLMLPQLEDKGLAEAGSNGTFSVSNLLMCSSVCGVGVDTVPVAGDVATENLALLFLDVHSLATKWNKPLSCRVMPVIGKKVGEYSDFESPYLTNSKIMDI